MRTKYSFSRSGIFLGAHHVKSSYTTVKMMVIYFFVILFIILIGVSVGSINSSKTPVASRLQ
jgi:hypothetical protein